MTYLDHYNGNSGKGWEPTHSWDEHTRQRLLFTYGPERVALILAGKDPETEADLRAWKRFCR